MRTNCDNHDTTANLEEAINNGSIREVCVTLQTIPALTIAAIDLLKAFPSSSCKQAVEPSYRPRSPGGLSSPARGFHRWGPAAAPFPQAWRACLVRACSSPVGMFFMGIL